MQLCFVWTQSHFLSHSKDYWPRLNARGTRCLDLGRTATINIKVAVALISTLSRASRAPYLILYGDAFPLWRVSPRRLYAAYRAISYSTRSCIPTHTHALSHTYPLSPICRLLKFRSFPTKGERNVLCSQHSPAFRNKSWKLASQQRALSLQHCCVSCIYVHAALTLFFWRLE